MVLKKSAASICSCRTWILVLWAANACQKYKSKKNTKKRRENMLLFEEAKAIKKRKTSSKYV